MPDEIKKKEIIKQRELLKTLPYFLTEYFRAIENVTSQKTRIGYCYDLRIFFNYLIKNERDFQHIKLIEDFEIDDFKTINIDHLESYIDYLSYYTKVDEQGVIRDLTNAEKGKSRKISALRTLFKFYFKRRIIGSNPAELLMLPKIHDKAITRLEPHEVSLLLDVIENGDKLSEGQKKYHNITKKRDFAIIILMLGTGMRVSECVGIDLNHLNFDNNSVLVTRKGGNQVILYFGKEVRKGLIEYIKEREVLMLETSDDAFFLSMQKKRITTRAVQNLVKKYAKNVTTLKNISPHKLRSTFGTNLYKESGDIYLVADALGHSDVNTTRKHYAEIDDERRRTAPGFITLREE